MNLPYSVKLKNAENSAAKYEAMAQRADDLTRPLDRFGHLIARKTYLILRSGERGIQSRHGEDGLAGAISHVVWFGAQVRWLAAKAYAAVQQFGGLVKSSRSGGYLSIPIADNLKAGGDPRFVSPTLVADGFFFRSDRTGALLFARVNKKITTQRKRQRGRAAASLLRWARDLGSKLELLFALKKEVVIPEHKYLTIDPKDLQEWNMYVADWILRGR